jgi:hypothetical protein
VGVLMLLGTGFTLWMAVEAVRRGQASGWLWIILLFGPIGAAVYFFSEYIDDPFRAWRGTGRRVTAEDLRHAEADVKRLDNTATWLTYASALRARKDYRRAVEAAQKAVERDASNIDAHYELAQALIDAGRPREARAPLETVVAAKRSYDSEKALYSLAMAQLAAGEVEAARAALDEVGSRSSRPEFLYQLGAVEAQLGHRDEAARALQRIIHESELVPAYLQREVRPWVRKAHVGLRKLGF